MKPYYADDTATLYHGDMREVLPALVAAGLRADCIVADPPYGETSLPWDRWPNGWIAIAADAAPSMWCFGGLRLFLRRSSEFAGWALSQDVIWSKHAGSSMRSDRFRRFHEIITHWYQGRWSGVYKDPQRVETGVIAAANRTARSRPKHFDYAGRPPLGDRPAWADDGTRLMSSILHVRSMHRAGAVHPTEKPVDLLTPLIRYACPPGGLVLDPFAGSGSTAVAARAAGRRAVLIEGSEQYCEAIARRLAQDVLPIATA